MLARCTGALPDGAALPAFLRGKRVMQLDLGLLIAGAKERGELESRVTSLLSEIRAAGDVVLMCARSMPLSKDTPACGRAALPSAGLHEPSACAASLGASMMLNHLSYASICTEASSQRP